MTITTKTKLYLSLPAKKMRERILSAANGLFISQGYGGTTMKEVAQAAGCSVGYLYKHFKGKQELLDVLAIAHMDTFEEIRRQVRGAEGRVGLDCLKRELELLCDHLVDHRALIPVFASQEASSSGLALERKRQLRRADVALLDEARRRGEVPDLDPRLLAAVLDGAVWALIKALATTEQRETFLTIPDAIDTMLLTPLRRQAGASAGKEPSDP